MTVGAARAEPAMALQKAVIAIVLLFPFLAYFATAASIVAIWDSSGTFAHGYVILPISLWLIWNRREQLRPLQVQPWWPALAALAACGMLWLLAEMGEVQVVRQYAFAAMLPLSALAILGLPIARTLAFPLFFILFAVPFGDVFIDPLIDITANFTVDALVATGIPVYREGNHFSIPSGNWSVVEACSGVRYLISSVTLGSLYAYLTYRSPWRRALFVLMSIIVPILANGARAYMIVMMGHLSDMTVAVGFDHLIYGWIFFGFVMFLLFWIGSYWRDDKEPEGQAEALRALPSAPPAPARQLLLAAAAIIACVGVWPAYNLYLERSAAAPAPVVVLDGLRAAAPGVAPIAPFAPFDAWRPGFPAARAELQQAFTVGGQPVGLTVLYYRQPPEGTKLITSLNRVVPAGGPWRQVGATVRSETVGTPMGTRTLALRETAIDRPGARLLVWHWYWIDGATTSSDVAGKLMQIRQKLASGADDGAAVLLAAPYEEQPETARKAMRAFLAADLAQVEAALAANRRR